MKSEFKPNVIVKVDAMVDEFASKDGREKLLKKYVESSEAGMPWILPGGDTFQVESVKPLTLNDLAINESVEIDKKTVASILDCPAFVLGVGSFNKDEWNNWIHTRVKSICDAIGQAFTRSILIKPDWYFKFNYRSLLSYDIQTLSTVGANMYTRGILTGNEVRDSLGYSPMDGLDELVILENYIPQGMIGYQKKLEGNANE
jgi:HK97 family phage portal protein